jgi:ATP-dependent DNA helicase RecG
MDDRELERLLSDVESDRSERTMSMDKTDKFGEAICAFANDLPNHGRPGYLFVGATPDGKPTGEPITDRLLQTLAAIRANGNVLPTPRMNVEKKSINGGELAVVEVFPSELPPVRYKGVTWIRVGPGRARASEADERVLSERRASLARTWDARPCSAAEVSDLTLGLFETYRVEAIASDVIDENHRSIEEQLASLRLLERRSRKPTNAGILLFAKDVLGFVPGAYVQFVEYEGEDAASDVRRERSFSGDLFSTLRELSALAEELAHGRPVEVAPLQEATVYEYPPAALREMLLNAVIHRDYESNTPVMISKFADRLEILNPGGLYGDMRVEDFPGATAYRNPVLAEAAKTLGFVNRFGRGVPRTVEAMKKNGSAKPEFAPTERHFLVVLRSRS